MLSSAIPDPPLELTTHRFEIRYSLPGPLIQETALGTKLVYRRDDSTVTLMIPSEPAEFHESDEAETIYIPALSPDQPRLQGTPAVRALNLIKIWVDFPGTGSMQDKKSRPFEEIEQELERSLSQGLAIANTEATRFTAWLRVETSQSWLGTGDEPSTQYGRCYLRDAGADGYLIAYGPQQSFTMRHGEIGASVNQLDDIRTRLSGGEDVPPELELFADARFFARESDLVDGQRAILAAAMAAEIATKRALLRRSSIERRPVVEILLKSRSNVPDLVSKIASAAIDRSLKTEDPKLFGQLQELTELRNQVVHGGRRVDRDKAYTMTFAVEKLLAWLE